MESSSSSSGVSRRTRGFDNIRNVVSCLVDGCNSDLSQCREYHRRHKVCEIHSKTPTVTIGGREQRFCQQCSRFHSLVEFDDGKRSCRKRLDGHNRRRRKPQSDSLSKSPTRFLANQPGTMLSFRTTPQLLPSAEVVNSSWAGPLKLENNAGSVSGSYYCHDNVLAHSFPGGNQFIPEQSFCKPVYGTGSGSGNSSNNGYGTRVVESDCALSLLSSATAENSLVQNMQYCDQRLSHFSQGMGSSNNAHNNNNNNNNNFHCHGLFHDGPSSSGPDPTLSFKWE